MWQIESISKNDEGIAVSMFIDSDEQTRLWWPGEFRLVHRVTFGPVLRLELICTNTGANSYRFEEALHTYNHVADIRQTRLQGLDTTHFLDNTDSNREKIQHGDIAIASQIDNAYLNTVNAVDATDLKLRRQIRLQKTNARNTVVWNPWQEGAAKMQDLGDGEWNQFICVEGCNIRDAAVTLAPRQEHKMTAVLSVTKL